MNPETKKELAEYFLGLADDELILGHRNSEWCGHAPILEEDIAFANLALDEIGHAGLWYGLVADLLDEDPVTFPDTAVYFRDLAEYRSIQMVELPIGDWAFSTLRQYFFDALENARLNLLIGSSYTPAAEIAAKIQKEELYHFRHSQAWVRRLGLGTDESHQRMQKALDELWLYTTQPFLTSGAEAGLVDAGLVPQPAALKTDWMALVEPLLQECQLQVPEQAHREISRQQHTPHLKILLAEMQSLPRSEPEAEW